MSDAGWGWPGNARKAHYFAADESIALCGKWMFTGERESEDGTSSRDDCAVCRRKVNRHPTRGVPMSDEISTEELLTNRARDTDRDIADFDAFMAALRDGRPVA